MAHIETPDIDKSAWGNGPWQQEPDRAEWRHPSGLVCLAARSPRLGNWCGYVAVPPGHPLHGKHYDEPDVDVHGGLTYADACQWHICHVPKPGEPDDVWWFGFDCGHSGDLSPGMRSSSSVFDPMLMFSRVMGGEFGEFGGTYKTLVYVRRETNKLAKQLAAVK